MHNIIDIEYSFLGGCMLNPDIIGDSSVHSDHFSDHLCSIVFDKMKEGVVDVLLIAREIGHDKELGIMISSAHSAATRDQGRAITAEYRKRKFIKALDMAYTQVNNGAGVDEIITELSNSSELSSDSRYRHVQELALNVYHDMESRHNGEDDGRFIATGFDDFDSMIGGIERQSLVIVAGRPSMGKTAFAMNVCQNVAKEHKVCFSSIEMDELQVGYRLTASLSNMDLKKLRADKNFPQEIWQGAAQATMDMKDLNLYIDENANRTVSQIAAQARRHKAKFGLDVLMVDYLGLIKSEGTVIKQRHLEIADMTRTFKALSKELNCCVMLLCQLNRGGETDKPRMSHLRESGSIEQDADMIIMPYRYTDVKVDNKGRETETERAKLIIVKNRNGCTGEVPVSWVGKCASYKNISHEDRF